MKIVIPDDYQDMVDRLECFALLRGQDVALPRAGTQCRRSSPSAFATPTSSS